MGLSDHGRRNDGRLPSAGILLDTARSQSRDGIYFRPLPFDLRGMYLEIAGAGWQRMKNARLRQTRQSDSREGSSFDHDLAGNADGLVVSGPQGRAEHERRQSHHAPSHFAQTRVGGDDEGNSGSP